MESLPLVDLGTTVPDILTLMTMYRMYCRLRTQFGADIYKTSNKLGSHTLKDDSLSCTDAVTSMLYPSA